MRNLKLEGLLTATLENREMNKQINKTPKLFFMGANWMLFSQSGEFWRLAPNSMEVKKLISL